MQQKYQRLQMSSTGAITLRWIFKGKRDNEHEFRQKMMDNTGCLMSAQFVFGFDLCMECICVFDGGTFQ